METKLPIPLAVLVGIQMPDVEDVAHQASLEELGRLVKTLGYEVVGTVSQKREGTGAGSLLGSGSSWTGSPDRRQRCGRLDGGRRRPRCVFRRKAAGDSDPSQPVITTEASH